MKSIRIIIFILLSLEYINTDDNALDTVEITHAPDDSNAKNLEKYGTKKVPYDDYMVSFDASDFKEGEEMHFKIKFRKDTKIENYIYYQYIDGNIAYDPNAGIKKSYDIKYNDEEINLITFETRYFTIKKDRKEYRGTNGNLLIIEFYFNGFPGDEIEITNTKEDEGKLEPWAIALIVVAVVVVLGVVVVVYCVRRKKQLAAMNQKPGYVRDIGVNQNVPYSQPGTNYGPGGQPYQQQYDQYDQPIANYDAGVQPQY